MTILLSICLPTFNRASLLDKQLDWLNRAIQGYEAECEVFISDNCSTDDTPAVIRKWQSQFLLRSDLQFRVHCNSHNVGAVKNIAHCISAAQGKYVWTISDDDLIYENTLGYILNTLRQTSDLSLLVLNYSSRFPKTKKLHFARCFNLKEDTVYSNGLEIFERCLEERAGAGISLTTALVYKTKQAQKALQEWQEGLDNFFVQLYWTGFCALHGSVKVTVENYLECTAGKHHYTEKPAVYVRTKYADLPAVYVKLSQLGYSREICRKLTFRSFRRMNWRLITKGFIHQPKLVTQALIDYALSTWRIQIL
ncbi:MAG TPA: glycosyltransferase family 2 protein [Crinalium sp.]